MKVVFAALAIWASAILCEPAAAETKAQVVVWPTLTPAGDFPAGAALDKPRPTDKPLFERAQELDITLRDAAQDLGYALDVSDPGPAPGHLRDEDLIERAQSSGVDTHEDGTWVISPRIERAGGSAYVVRIVAVPPHGHELRVRVETVAGDSVYVRGLVMLRELLASPAAIAAAVERERELAARGTSQGIMSQLRSEGRAILALNAALFGAFTAFSAQRASGSDDPRVVYPLLAVGTGVGIGASLLVADEWNVTTGDAWYLAAGGWWGAASALLMAAGQDLQPLDERYAWGVGGGLLGVGLATVALTRKTMDEGGATLAHSGGALGLVLGGATELLARGTTEAKPDAPGTAFPATGAGLGAAVGLIAAGALATRAQVSPSRVLLVDLGVGGGALIGAAAASPLLFANIDHPTQSNTRGSLSATMGGALAGGVLAWWLTREMPAPSRHTRIPGSPSVGVIGASASRHGAEPAYGVTWGGEF